jgi:hypothetical protein
MEIFLRFISSIINQSIKNFIFLLPALTIVNFQFSAGNAAIHVEEKKAI